MRRVARVAVCCAFALAPGACSSCNGKPTEHLDAAVAPGGLTPEQAAQVLARVGDRTITLGDYIAAIEHMDQFDRMRYQAAERRKELLHEMIDVMLLADEAREKGYDNDPIAQQEMREILRDAILARAREGVPAPNDIGEEEVRAYFEAHKGDFHDPERRRLSLVVMNDKRAAEGVLEQAKKASAAQWGEIVRARSIDAQAKANVPVDLAGDVGFVAPPGDARGVNARVPEEVRAAAYDAALAKPGDVLPRVVEAGARSYLVRLTSKTEAHDRSLPEAERAIRVRLAQEKIRAKEQALLDELRKQFPVQIDEAALAQVKVEVPDAGGE